MSTPLLQGELVRLAAVEPEEFAGFMANAARDSEYWRLMASDPSRVFSKRIMKEWVEKNNEKALPDDYYFNIRRLTDNHLMGSIGLDGILWNHGEAFVGIDIGDRECWGQGYGTDAMRVILRYAFEELGLHRVALDVFEYNPRAIRSYEKAGFKHEGRQRQWLNRGGRRWDLIFMGILRAEWQEMYG